MKTHLLFLFLLPNIAMGQGVRGSALIMSGHRSAVYQHSATYRIGQQWSLNNFVYFDTQYSDGEYDLYNIRNTVRYSVNKNVHARLAAGLKNPGAYLTFSTLFSHELKHSRVGLSIGGTAINGFEFEHSLLATQYLTRNHQCFAQFVLVVSHTSNKIIRGIEQFRIGWESSGSTFGLGLNLDQFGGTIKDLKNAGLYYSIRL